jgi:NTP pyrophosphatase (non-canonical NTP hydrolase)
MSTYDLRNYQNDALRTATVDEIWPLDPLGIALDALGISGEAGEVADLVKKYIGHGHALNREKVKKELVDVLWYVAVLAHRLGFTLEEVAAANVAKLRARYPEGFSTEASIARVDTEEPTP